MKLKKSFDDLDNQSEKQTKNDHGGDWEIKSEIFFFDSDISGQPSNPMQFVVEEINNDPNDHNKQSDSDDPFAGFTAHESNLLSFVISGDRLLLLNFL
jgi:hypothetical protein